MDVAKLFWGLLFIVLGVLLLLTTLGYLSWGDWWKFSPLIFIFLGILILLSKPIEKRRKEEGEDL
jgi:sulfite exporter TauE/SafE